MKVLQVQKYNRLQIQKYSHDFDTWVKNGGYSSRDYPPQSMFYGFYHNGNFRQTGYVAFNEKRAVLRATKKKAVEDFINSTV